VKEFQEQPVTIASSTSWIASLVSYLQTWQSCGERAVWASLRQTNWGQCARWLDAIDGSQHGVASDLAIQRIQAAISLQKVFIESRRGPRRARKYTAL